MNPNPAFQWLNNAGDSFNTAVQDLLHGLAHPAGPPGGQQGFNPMHTQQQQPEHNTNAQNGGTQVTPPASRRAIRQLPTIRVSPEDLVDPSNRECCICLEENCLDDKVTRLPCAHIFHEDCVIDWLTNHHCTCPVCRYELPTDNPLYEAGRLERMKTRKPRYAMYELRRMPVPELLAIYKQPAPGILEKEDLIDLLIRKERIQVVPAPEPVEYSLEVLKRMKIRELKRAMEHAGVFFHAKDVVEKSDMLTIFLNSGRLSLLPSENDYPVASGRKEDSGSKTAPPPGDQEKISVPSKRPLVETVQECSDDENDHGRDMPLSPPQEMFGSDGISSLFSRGPVVNEGDETVSLPARGNVALDQQPTLESNEDINDDETQGSDLPSVMEGVALSKKNDVDASGCLIETMPTRQASPPPSISEEAMIPPLISNTDAEQGHSKSIKTSSGLQYSNHGKCPFQEYTISHLQELAKINNIDVSSCFERGEMVNLLLNAGIAMKHPSEVFRENLSNFNVSELRVLASEVSIDLSQCNDKEEMLHCIVQEAMTERPHLQSYLRSLSPLAKLSLNELRRTAREWGVNINDCLEKGEIMQRLISRGQRFGGF